MGTTLCVSSYRGSGSDAAMVCILRYVWIASLMYLGIFLACWLWSVVVSHMWEIFFCTLSSRYQFLSVVCRSERVMGLGYVPLVDISELLLRFAAANL